MRQLDRVAERREAGPSFRDVEGKLPHGITANIVWKIGRPGPRHRKRCFHPTLALAIFTVKNCEPHATASYLPKRLVAELQRSSQRHGKKIHAQTGYANIGLLGH